MSDNAAATIARFGSPKAIREQPDEEELECWGYVRGQRRAFNIEFRRLRGTWPALEYAWLHCPTWCPAPTSIGEGIEVPAASIVLAYSTGHTVIISGRNLREPYHRILEHQVKYLAEADTPSADLADDEAVVVERVQIIEPKE
ncbi:MAG: hypothetical protein ACJ8C4_07130 [Gemmataceae bacterium]